MPNFRVAILLPLVLLLPLLAAPALGLTCADRVALTPPPVGDDRFSAWLAEETVAAIKRAERLRCSPFLPYSETSPTFDVVGSTSSYPSPVEDFREKQVTYLVKKHRVGYLVFLRPLKDGETSALADLYKIGNEGTLTLVKSYRIAFKAAEAARHKSKPLPRFLAKIAANAVTSGFSSTDVYFNPDNHYTNGTTTTHGILPPIISAMSLTQIEHPLGYRMFDVAGSISPGGYLFSINQDSSFQRKPGVLDQAQYPDTVTLHFEATGACGNVNAGAAFFSPIGTTYAGVGWGPCLVHTRIERQPAKLHFADATRLFFGHRVFVTDHVFVSLDVDLLLFSRSLYRSPYASASEIERSSFNVGWYIADSEGLFLKSWDLFTGLF